MRSLMKLIVALLMTVTSTRDFAQRSEVIPEALPTQIVEQEAIVMKVPGSQNRDAWFKMAVLLQDAARYRESEAAYRRTLELIGTEDSATLADVLDHMGTMYVEAGQPAKAEPIERRALATREQAHDQLGSGVSHMHLAMLLLGEHALASAEAEAESAVRMLLPASSSPSANDAATPEEKMTALIDLSLVECASGAYSTAIPDLKWALGIAHTNFAFSLPS